MLKCSWFLIQYAMEIVASGGFILCSLAGVTPSETMMYFQQLLRNFQNLIMEGRCFLARWPEVFTTGIALLIGHASHHSPVLRGPSPCAQNLMAVRLSQGSRRAIRPQRGSGFSCMFYKQLDSSQSCKQTKYILKYFGLYLSNWRKLVFFQD